MADVQTEDGYTRLANELVEALARVNLTAYQQRVLWVIWRKTYGWNKKADSISRSQFIEITGMDSRNILRTIKELEKINVITVERNSTRTAKYAFQKDFEKWRLVSNKTQGKRKQLVSNETPACVSTDAKTCVSTDTHKRKKENNKRNIVQRLFDKETLSVFLLEKNLPYSVSIVAMILEFINKVRMANKHKAIAAARAVRLADTLSTIAEKYGPDNMAAGIQAAFKKADREGFNFSGHDPAAYVRAVAKGECSKTRQQQAEAALQAEKAALRAAPASGLWNEIQESFSA